MRTKDRFAQRVKTAMLKDKRLIWNRLIILVLIPYSLFLTPACNTEANYETKDVEVHMNIMNVSSGFIECEYSTNKDAYYLIAICEPWEDFNPITNSKQFMQLALDSAYAEYLVWRNDLLRNKEFNVAPFASHSLQYGQTTHFFTGLTPYSDYWVFAFPVDPETMQPVGKLVLENIQTPIVSTVEVRFEYRVRGMWDYVYPVDTLGHINSRYPFITITKDSLELTSEIAEWGTPLPFFYYWEEGMFEYPQMADVFYGVKATENDGLHSTCEFEEGHTYYTGITGFDGLFKHMAIYKFTWHEDCVYYFQDTDSTNLYIKDQDKLL